MEMHDEDAVIVYTDGSQFSSPRRGGIGIRLCWTNDEGREEIYDHLPPGYRDVTVPLMELKAVIEALRRLLRQQPLVPPSLYSKVVVYSDAMYIIDGHQSAHGSWQRSKWHTRDGTPVQNAEQWKELLRLERRLGKRMEVRKVKGHSKNPHNRAVDKLARQSANAASIRASRRQSSVANEAQGRYSQAAFRWRASDCRFTSTAPSEPGQV